MQALAVYNRPVIPAAVDFLLAPHLPAVDSAPILQRLANMHFARKESGRFYLHPVDREFAYDLLPEGENMLEEFKEADFDFEQTDSEEQFKDIEEVLENENDDASSDTNPDEIDFEELFKNYRFKQSRTDFTQFGLLNRAADYFVQARKPRTEWKK